jgi:hypothetical protein
MPSMGEWGIAPVLGRRDVSSDMRELTVESPEGHRLAFGSPRSS